MATKNDFLKLQIDKFVQISIVFIGRTYQMKMYIGVLGIITLVIGLISIFEITRPKKEITFEQYLEIVVRMNNLNLEQKKNIRDNLLYLSTEFSINIIPYLYKADNQTALFFPSKPKIYGFEKLGIRNSSLAELWSQQYYPKKWVEGNIKTVAFNSSLEDSIPSPGYGLRGYNAGGVIEFTHKINLFGSPNNNILEEKATRENLDWIFSHELGHNNDWINARYLKPIERISFLVEISKRFRNPHSFRDFFGYVNSIKNPDKHKQNYYHVREWWGSLCEEYFTFPEILTEKWPEDFALVDRYVKKQDANFDTFKTSKERASKLKKILEE